MAVSENRFEESGLFFHFPENWRVLKYDDHRFFRTISGRGMSGADFIWVDDSSMLTIMEVKHFRRPGRVSPARSATDTDAQELVSGLAKKMVDTLTGLRVVNGYLSGKLSYRLWRWLNWQSGIPMRRFFEEWDKWFRLYEAYSHNNCLRLCLWIEEDGQRLDADRLNRLKRLLGAEFLENLPEFSVECEVASRDNVPYFLKDLKVGVL